VLFAATATTPGKPLSGASDLRSYCMSYRQSPLGSRSGGYGRRQGPPVVPIVITVVILLVAGVVGYLVWPNSTTHAGTPSASSSIAPPSGPGVPPVADAADAFAKAWDAQNLATTSYARGIVGTDVQAAYKTITKNLQQRSVEVTVGAITPAAEVAGLAVDSAALTVAWTLPGGSVWTYQSSVQFTLDDGSWEVVWTPQTIQPKLGDGDSLRYARTLAKRATITDGSGAPIVTDRPVVDIGVEPAGTVDAASTASALATILKTYDTIDVAALTSQIKSAGPHQFVDVITLREADFDPLSMQLQAVPGVILNKETEDLSPTHAFSRAFIGTVGPVTKEIVDDSNGHYIAGDDGGLSGLEKEFDSQLGGTNGYTVSVVHSTAPAASGSASAPASTDIPAPTALTSVAPIDGKTLHTTLDVDVENAADAALSSVTTQPSALVAVRVSTGQVIAVANGPYTGYDTALLGQTPPGSAFKIVTTLGLLEGGFNVNTNVPCLAKIVVQGKTFQNYEGEAFGDTPFHTDFAKSCNSAFISLRAKVPGATLPTAAKSLGIGACWSLGTAAFRGSVPTPATDVDLAATSFGQGQTLVSPVDLAVAAASVARGSYIAPTLLTNGKVADCSNVNGVVPTPTGTAAASAPASSAPVASTAAAAPVALPAGPIAQLRSLMREVVTDGTASVLLKAPGLPVMAKTGTAEYGAGDKPSTHAWLVGYQGDIAFAVYVQDGQSGGTVAAPLALTFLQNLAATGTK
jgi:cell division protein FtsI/penicillin-binding protein 2